MDKTPKWYISSPIGVILLIKVSPSAKKCQALPYSTESPWIKIAITAPPDKGKANEMLLSFVAKILRVKNSDCALLSGSTSKQKKVSISKKMSYQDILTLLYPRDSL
jgi:uncharacterized protein (TIGR00251 family)